MTRYRHDDDAPGVLRLPAPTRHPLYLENVTGGVPEGTGTAASGSGRVVLSLTPEDWAAFDALPRDTSTAATVTDTTTGREWAVTRADCGGGCLCAASGHAIPADARDGTGGALDYVDPSGWRVRYRGGRLADILDPAGHAVDCRQVRPWDFARNPSEQDPHEVTADDLAAALADWRDDPGR